MATVTMSGKEYQELTKQILELENKIHEAEEWMNQLVSVEFNEDEWYSWGAGRMPNAQNTNLPHWMQDYMTKRLVWLLSQMDLSIVARLRERGIRYFNPFDTNLGTYGKIDLVEASDLMAEMWDEALSYLDEEEEADET